MSEFLKAFLASPPAIVFTILGVLLLLFAASGRIPTPWGSIPPQEIGEIKSPWRWILGLAGLGLLGLGAYLSITASPKLTPPAVPTPAANETERPSTSPTTTPAQPPLQAPHVTRIHLSAEGVVTIIGTTIPGFQVEITNLRTGDANSARADRDGQFGARIPGRTGDQLQLIARDENNARAPSDPMTIKVPPPPPPPHRKGSCKVHFQAANVKSGSSIFRSCEGMMAGNYRLEAEIRFESGRSADNPLFYARFFVRVGRTDSCETRLSAKRQTAPGTMYASGSHFDCITLTDGASPTIWLNIGRIDVGGLTEGGIHGDSWAELVRIGP